MSILSLQKMRYKVGKGLVDVRLAKKADNLNMWYKEHLNEEEKRLEKLIQDLEYTCDRIGRSCSGYRTALGEKIYLGDRILQKNDKKELIGVVKVSSTGYHLRYLDGSIGFLEDEAYTQWLAEVE
jgi:hypothetical protein